MAVALEIPTRASAAEILWMIEGKIVEDGREPVNVQVVVKEGEGGVVQLQLQGAEGVSPKPDFMASFQSLNLKTIPGIASFHATQYITHHYSC